MRWLVVSADVDDSAAAAKYVDGVTHNVRWDRVSPLHHMSAS